MGTVRTLPPLGTGVRLADAVAVFLGTVSPNTNKALSKQRVADILGSVALLGEPALWHFLTSGSACCDS
ncbi:hypothetical protein [Rhodococcus koreensis]|uniref:hypothetical protein n=1 Tax=Rhodococcus koreensis TaxID=99653 RepID=UPI00366A5CF5